MREVIYYPGFEVRDKDWLKFALLYLGKLDPIVPHSGDPHVSDWFKRLQNESDLISIHRPTHNEGHLATLDALTCLDSIMRHPGRFEGVFKTPDVVKKWVGRKQQKYELFGEKYSYQLERFCIENRIGRRSKHGLLVPREVANVYMTVLANAIADSRGLSPITDYRTLDRYSVFSRIAKPAERLTLQTAQGILKLKLPRDLSAISLKKVVQHRNTPGFQDTQRAFHQALSDFISEIEQGNPQSFEESLGSCWQEFSDDVLKVGTGVGAFSLGVWLVLAAGAAAPLQAAREVLGGAGLAIGSIVSIRSTWKNSQTNRYARRYLANLKNLRPEKTLMTW